MVFLVTVWTIDCKIWNLWCKRNPGVACAPHISCILGLHWIQCFHLKKATVQCRWKAKLASVIKAWWRGWTALLVPCEGRRSGIMYESSVPFLRAVRALYAPRHAALHRLMTSWPRNRGFHQQRPPLSTKRLDRQSFCYDCWALLRNQFQCFA